MERLRAVNIVSSYGRKRVLSGVNISAGAGQCVGIVGTNGCGKSTLLNIIAGLKKPDSGDICFDGQCASGKGGRKLFMAYAGYVPQENNLIPELSVLDNLCLWYPSKAVLEQELKQGFLHELEIDQMCRMKAGQLSGGMKKRVSIGCALAGNPPILILDEPTTGLHAADIEKVVSILEAFVDRGNTVIVIEHNTDVMKLADYIIDIGPDGGTKGGEVVFTGTPKEMLESGRTITAKYLRK